MAKTTPKFMVVTTLGDGYFLVPSVTMHPLPKSDPTDVGSWTILLKSSMRINLYFFLDPDFVKIGGTASWRYRFVKQLCTIIFCLSAYSWMKQKGRWAVNNPSVTV